jgi:hypothetical protein
MSLHSTLGREVILPHRPSSVFTHPLNISEDYGIRWSFLKVARDLLQNFNDALKSLDLVNIDLKDLGNNRTQVKIASPSVYDHNDLLILGGTSKSNSETNAGGFGEGSKMAAMCLLRDYGASEVNFHSGSASVCFKLAPMPKHLGKPGRWLEAVIMPEDLREFGNYIEFDISTELLSELLKAKEFFYSATNQRLSNPNLEIEDDQARLGIKLCLDGSKMLEGSLYDGGQARNSVELGKPLKGVTLYAVAKRIFPLTDRERSPLDEKEILSKFMLPILQKASSEQLSKLLQDLEPLWCTDNFQYGTTAYRLLEYSCKILNQREVVLNFADDSKYTSVPSMQPEVIKLVKDQGYIPCVADLALVGMKTNTELDAKDLSREASPEELQRLGILTSFLEILYKAVPEDISCYELKYAPREIKIWQGDNLRSGCIADPFRHDEEIFFPISTLQLPFDRAIKQAIFSADLTFGSEADVAKEQAEISNQALATLLDLCLADTTLSSKLIELRSAWESGRKH